MSMEWKRKNNFSDVFNFYFAIYKNFRKTSFKQKSPE